MLKGIPPHRQLITHNRIPLHVGCTCCGYDLFGALTEYTQYAAVVLNWPEAQCPECGTPQYVNLGSATRFLGDQPPYKPATFLNTLRRWVARGWLPAERLLKHTTIQVHAACKTCHHDLYGEPTDYWEHTGMVLNWPEVWCSKCGTPQYVDLGELSTSLGPMPEYDRNAFVTRLRDLTANGAIPSEAIVKHSSIQVHICCMVCGYDLFNLSTEYLQWAGIIIDPPEVKCPECGQVQRIDVAGGHWRLDSRLVKDVLTGHRRI